ncbi:MAG: thrombospondin type 3 repeat-containing protein, partial [Kangiellaceae bacterium]|nr:thrombospondin type 3 repeat-containing protein [Kangiellaceae bacterium]
YGSATNQYTRALIVNNSANPVSGYFDGIREGEGVLVNNDFYMHVSYTGGDGNDVVIWRGDDDNDGVANRTDRFDDDPNEWADSDGDGTGDNADQMPDDPTETLDSDGDGIGDNADAFDDNPLESVDSDGDGIGDNRDAFPNDPNEHTDSDNDGIGDNAETDKDNDGLEDGVDNCPLISNFNQNDMDGDTVGDACDIDNDADGLIDISTLSQLYNIRFNLTGTAYNDGYFETAASCGDGVTVTACRGYELLNDFDFDENRDGLLNDTFNQGQGWLPIGNSSNRFDSIFEGNNFHIKNLTIDNTNRSSHIGFFGYITSSNIQNIHFSGDLTQINSTASFVGGIAGQAGTVVNISNVSFKGRLSTDDSHKYIGGLFGNAGQAKIYDSFADVTISGGAEFVGGLAGASSVAFVERNYAIVDIMTTANKVGGLFGIRKSNWIQQNYTKGIIVSTGNDIGGLVGYSTSGIYDSYSFTSVSGDHAVGGLAGYTTSSIRRSYSTGTISGNYDSGGLAGEFEGSTDSDNYWDTDSSSLAASAAGIGYPTSELQTPTDSSGIYVNWSATQWDFGVSTHYPALILNGVVHRDTDNDGIFDQDDFDDDNDGDPDATDAFPFDENEWDDTDADGTGNNADTDDDNDGVLDIYDDFPLDDTEQYDTDNDGIGNNSDDNDDNDSLLDGADNCPIHANDDQLDNDGDTYGDACDIDNDADGLIDISTLEQLNNVRNNLAGTGYHNGDFEVNQSCGDGVTITNCSGYELLNDLNFDENADGIENDNYNQGEGWLPIGANQGNFKVVFEGNNFRILNLVINNTSLEYDVGLFGRLRESSIRNLHVSGKITAQAQRVGGIAGSKILSKQFHNLSFIGNVTTTTYNYIGGLVGHASQGDITSSRFIGNVNGGASYVGGIVGYKAWGKVRGNYSEGSVVGSGDRVGGIVGSSHNNNNDYNYSTANITGINYVGGLVGYFSGPSVNYNYALGEVSGTNNTGNVVGFDSIDTTTDSYWNSDLATQIDNGVGASYTTVELQGPTDATGIYADWGTTYWDFGSDSQYPKLIIDGVVHRDSDGDGVFDQLDAFPDDNSETVDTDGDGIGNNIDTDDDDDGITDAEDLYPLIECLSSLTVTNNLASGANSLQRRLLEVCENGIVTFDNDYTIDLTNLLVIPRNVTIDGSGFKIRINANGMLGDSNADLILRNAVLNLNDSN